MRRLLHLTVLSSILAFTSHCVHPSQPDPSAESTATSSVQAWTRKPGLHADGRNLDRLGFKTLQMSSFKQITEERFDYQTQRQRTYRGVRLTDLIDAYKPAYAADTVLLHFSNGMLIPLPSSSSDPIYERLNALVATAKLTDEGTWSSAFPPVARHDEIAKQRDPVPVRFDGNKVVISDKPLPQAGASRYSPWRHVASLTALEFVDGAAYEAQFKVSDDTKAAAGFKIFQERCQYCHGVRQVGASFGWDFVHPLPIYKKRSPETLFSRVHFKKLDFYTVMPTQSDFSKEEAESVWQWMRDVAQKPLRAYKP